MSEYHEDLLKGLVRDGINRTLNEFGAAQGLKALVWSVGFEFEPALVGSVTDDVAELEERERIDAWGSLLGLHASSPAEEALGMPAWDGDLGEWRVSVTLRA